jgi:hypothetical protein
MRQFAIRLNDKLNGLLEIVAGLRQGCPLRIRTREFLNVTDPPIAVLLKHSRVPV